MNLLDLREFVGNLLDYDPSNDTYREQLTRIINDAQRRLLTDRPWDFLVVQDDLGVLTDLTGSFSVVNGSATVAGTGFPVSASTVLPGSPWELAEAVIDDGKGPVSYEVRYVASSNQLFLDRDYSGTTGTYQVTLRWRRVLLPADTSSLTGLLDLAVGIPDAAIFLSQFDRDAARLDPELLGRIEGYLPTDGLQVPAPRDAIGVAIVAATGQGTRTIHVWQCNVWSPRTAVFDSYGPGISGGFESGLSRKASYTLADNETLEFTPETIPRASGLWRRYYFTCPELGIEAPVRVRHAGQEGGISIDTDTVSPAGGVTLQPDLSKATLATQTFQTRAIRWRHNQGGMHQAITLYPHPASDQSIRVRRVRAPEPLYEDQDVAAVPEAYAPILAYAALEQLTLKADTPALSAVYQRKKEVLFQGMEQRYMGKVPRRLVKGAPAAGQKFAPNPFGPLKFTP